jgi:hypothetical protein
MCEPDDYSEVSQSSTVHARKPHTCYACHETIQPGDYYTRTSDLFDGQWSTLNHCLRCWAMFKALCARDGSALYDLNCGEEWEDPPPEIAALAFVTRAEAQRSPGLTAEYIAAARAEKLRKYEEHRLAMLPWTTPNTDPDSPLRQKPDGPE